MRMALFRTLMATLVCLAWPTHPLLARTWEDILTIARRGQQRVDFYGVVLNQFGRPVPDAVIHYRTSAYGLLRPTYRTGRVSSGADGRFGRRTESAVRLFKQRASALRPDGICGADMRLALGIALEDGE